jgi:hypothetical protein
MLSSDDRRRAQALRVLLRSGRLAQARLPSARDEDPETMEALVHVLLAAVDDLERQQQRGVDVDAATWRVAGNNLRHLHQLALALRRA